MMLAGTLRALARRTKNFGISGRKRSTVPQTWSFETRLPDGYPARRIAIDVSVPHIPSPRGFTFADHVTDEAGRPSDTVVANGFGAFAISRDLGATWKIVPVNGFLDKDIAQLKAIGPSQFLAQAGDEKSERLDVLAVNDRGDVGAVTPAQSCRWHGCRSVARAGDTIMYAEYPHNEPVDGKRHAASRVFRSRDGGRTWDVVFQQSGAQIRHFHFLQPRPGVSGEWWLTSGDDVHESRVWVSKDDGDTWSDLTGHVSGAVDIDGVTYQRRVFRLTDLAWNGDEIIWGTDDVLKAASDERGRARLFRSKIGDRLEPHLIGFGNWHFRSLIDVSDFYIALSQGCPHPGRDPAKEMPGVYLVPKRAHHSAPGSFHLFDVPGSPGKRTKLSASRASRAAKDGVFFSQRGRADFFPNGHRVLKWKVTFS